MFIQIEGVLLFLKKAIGYAVLLVCLSTVFLTACSKKTLTSEAAANTKVTSAAKSESTSQHVRPELTGNATLALNDTWQIATEAGVTAHSFNLILPTGMTQKRRFLLYQPKGLVKGKSYPLVFALHGFGVNAEIYRRFDTYGDFERLADEHKFILVYGNAVSRKPQSGSDPFYAHTGVWGMGETGGPATDVAYLNQVEVELETMQIPFDRDKVFITGMSNGGQMTLYAVLAQPERYLAAASSTPPLPRFAKMPEKMPPLIYHYSIGDPFFDATYAPNTRRMIKQWALATGVSESDFDNAKLTLLPDLAVEGSDYKGEHPAALATIDSRISHVDYKDTDGNVKLRFYEMDKGGHGMPHPEQFEYYAIEGGKQGFRNQDLNSVDDIWEFFSLYL